MWSLGTIFYGAERAGSEWTRIATSEGRGIARGGVRVLLLWFHFGALTKIALRWFQSTEMLYGQAPLHSQTRDELLAKLCDPAEASKQ